MTVNLGQLSCLSHIMYKKYISISSLSHRRHRKMTCTWNFIAIIGDLLSLSIFSSFIRGFANFLHKHVVGRINRLLSDSNCQTKLNEMSWKVYLAGYRWYGKGWWKLNMDLNKIVTSSFIFGHVPEAIEISTQRKKNVQEKKRKTNKHTHLKKDTKRTFAASVRRSSDSRTTSKGATVANLSHW